MDPEREQSVNPDPGEPATPPEVTSAEQRESIRRNFLRANTTVAIILVAVLGLALAAVLASLRAKRHQRLAEQAQQEARTELWQTYLSKARAARLGSALDRRQESLRAIASAARIQSSAELRHEAIAALALGDFVMEQSWPLSEEATTQAFDRELQRYAIGWANGDIVVRRVSDNQDMQWLRQTNGEVPRTQGPAIGLEFSPDSNRLAARYQKGGAVVWDVGSAKPVFRQAVDQPRQALSRPRFTSDGRFLICMTAVPREGVAVFDLATGESVAHFPQFKPWMHAAPRPGTAMFSVNTETNVVLVMDWRTGQTIMSFPFPAGVQRMAWSSDGKYLALGGDTVDAHLWEVETGHKRILTGHTADVRNLVFDPNGERLASASWDGTSRLWETRSGRLLGVTDGFAQQFGGDGRLALSRFKGAVEIWSIRPSKTHRMHEGPGAAEGSTWAMDLSPDGRWLASLSMDKGLVIWDLVNSTPPTWSEVPGVRLLCFHPERPELYVTSQSETAGRKLTFDATTGTAPAPRIGEKTSISLPTNFSSHWVALSRDGRTMTLGSFFEGRTFVANVAAPEKLIWLKDLGHLTRSEAQSPCATSTGGGTLALNSDGSRAVCGFVYPHGTKVWDTRSGERIATLSSENAVVEFSPDDRWIVAGGRSQYQLFRAGDSFQELWRVPREGALLTTGPCAFSPDGRQLAVAKSSQMAAILDSATGRELAQLVAPRPATIKAIRWSQDGRRIVLGTGENLIQVWELETLHNELATLGLNWGSAPIAAALPGGPAAIALPVSGWTGPPWALTMGLAAAGVVTLVALIALGRHRRLIEDFARTEALAGQRERELRIERDVGRLKSSFVSMVSHEFRTPLGVITASVGSLQRYFSRLSEEQRAQLLADITSSSSRMKDLIEEVLLLGKVDSGNMKCQRVLVDLPALCLRAIAEVAAATGRARPIEFTAGILNGEALLDETLSGIILNNLLNNAVKYSPATGRICLTLRRERKDAVIEVSDEGIGIPETDRANLFTSFHRCSNVGSVPGTGLGLTIVKRCVELHRGGIIFVGTEGQGTTFVVRLPAF